MQNLIIDSENQVERKKRNKVVWILASRLYHKLFDFVSENNIEPKNIFHITVFPENIKYSRKGNDWFLHFDITLI